MNHSKPIILYVEDDHTLGFITRDNLEQHGLEVMHYTHGSDAYQAILSKKFDLAILDIMLPQKDGFELAAAIRQRSQDIPILFLSAKSMKEDRLNGFRLGGDDYITKPFSIEELLYKINVFLKRRSINNDATQMIFALGRYTYDHANLTLTDAQTKRQLTQREGALLRLFILSKNEICERAHILEQIWGENDYFKGRSLDVFISRLRKYLSSDPDIGLENIHGVGFKLYDHSTNRRQ